VTCPSCAIATQSNHAGNLERLMASSLRNVECYSYCGEPGTGTAVLSNCQGTALDSSSCEGVDA
jgi:hypothetical protein